MGSYALQVLARWESDGEQEQSRVYVETNGERNLHCRIVTLWLPGQGSIRLTAFDSRTVGRALLEAASDEHE